MQFSQIGINKFNFFFAESPNFDKPYYNGAYISSTEDDELDTESINLSDDYSDYDLVEVNLNGGTRMIQCVTQKPLYLCFFRIRKIFQSRTRCTSN